MHLTLISYPRSMDPRLEAAAFAARPDPAPHPKSRVFGRCQHPAQLRELLASHRRRVRLLDLVGHGRPGTLHLGSGPAVTPDPGSWSLLAGLDPYLHPQAELRLLGCATGTGQEGFEVLRGVSALLGRPVWGTVSLLYSADWGELGLKEEVARDLLVSSAGLDVPVPARRRFEGLPGEGATPQRLQRVLTSGPPQSGPFPAAAG